MNVTDLSEGIAVAKAIRTKPNTETKTRQSFPFCLLPSAFCCSCSLEKPGLGGVPKPPTGGRSASPRPPAQGLIGGELSQLINSVSSDIAKGSYAKGRGLLCLLLVGGRLGCSICPNLYGDSYNLETTLLPITKAIAWR